MDKHERIAKKIKKINKKQARLYELNAMIHKYETEIDEYFHKLLIENGIDKTDITHTTTNIEKECNDISTDFITNDEEKFCNILYKLLSLKTHPDKYNKSNDDSENEKSGEGIEENEDGEENDFIKIKRLYDKQDAYMLLKYANKYKIDYGEIDDNLINIILEKTMNSIIKDINTIKDTIAYHLLIYGNVHEYINTLKQNVNTKRKLDELNNRLHALIK